MKKKKGQREEAVWPCQKCGWCCEIFPIDTDIVNNNRHLFQRPVLKEEKWDKNGKDETIVITNSIFRDCVFLKRDNTCAIYENRPQLCKDYGRSDGSLACPYLTSDGKLRSEYETKEILANNMTQQLIARSNLLLREDQEE